MDRLVKQNGQWRFAHRRVDVDLLVSDPAQIVMLADPDVAPFIQPLMDAARRIGEQVQS